jgi:hypothetical protein
MLVYYQRKKIPQASNFNLIDIALLFLYIAFVVVIVLEETRIPEENHRSAASH